MAEYSCQLRFKVASVAIVFEKKQLRKVLRAAGNEVANAARALIRGAVRVAGPRGGRGASAPGSAPASRSGLLLNSIGVKVWPSGEGVSVRDSAPYALALEAGAARYAVGHKRVHRKRVVVGPNGLRMQPRPFLSAALDSRAASLLPRMQTAVEQDLKLVPLKS